MMSRAWVGGWLFASSSFGRVCVCVLRSGGGHFFGGQYPNDEV
jgi:hypothetical protein